MYCGKCGTPYEEGQAFCVKCGNNLKERTQIITSTAASTTESVGAVVYAGFWERFAAAIIDGFLLSVATYALVFLFMAITSSAASSEGSQAALSVGYLLFSIILTWLYFAILESSEKSATFGKRWLGMRVLREDSYERINFGRATARYFGKILSTILLYIGYLIQPFTKKRQALHDMMAGAVVVRDRDKAAGVVVAVAVIVGAMILISVIGILAAIAIPAYQDYVHKAEMARVMTYAQEATEDVTVSYQNTHIIPESLGVAGFSRPLPNEVRSIEIKQDNGIVVLNLSDKFQNGILFFVPAEDASGKITWACKYAGIPERYLPSSAGCTEAK